MNKLSFWFLLALISGGTAFTTACQERAALVAKESEAAQIIRRKEAKLVIHKDEEIWLRGVSFGNEVWTNNPLPTTHHNEQDFKRVADMGMNVIRFYLNYQTFEEDSAPYQYKSAGWDWLNQNIAWTKKYHIYLILNFHVPPGGFQSNGNGGTLWQNLANQRRLKALWHQIAKRYAREPAIAGYDLLNEPVVTQSISQWQRLAQQIADTIRLADKNHLLIVERLNAVNNKWDHVNSEQNFFLINDPNTMYTFHFYSPFEYTHQNANWTKLGDGGKYPDEHIQEEKKLVRNKAYLEHQLNQYLAFGRKHRVPLYLGEFGLYKDCFSNDKGGLAYVADMLDILHKEQLHFTYHVYHEDNFGIYYGYGKPVDSGQANNQLIALFREKLK